MRFESMWRTFSQTTSKTHSPAPYATLSAALSLMQTAHLALARVMLGFVANVRIDNIFDHAPSKPGAFAQLEGASAGIRNRGDRGSHLIFAPVPWTDTF
jgi:hypothetical protein